MSLTLNLDATMFNEMISNIDSLSVVDLISNTNLLLDDGQITVEAAANVAAANLIVATSANIGALTITGNLAANFIPFTSLSGISAPYGVWGNAVASNVVCGQFGMMPSMVFNNLYPTSLTVTANLTVANAAIGTIVAGSMQVPNITAIIYHGNEIDAANLTANVGNVVAANVAGVTTVQIGMTAQGWNGNVVTATTVIL